MNWTLAAVAAQKFWRGFFGSFAPYRLRYWQEKSSQLAIKTSPAGCGLAAPPITCYTRPTWSYLIFILYHSHSTVYPKRRQHRSLVIPNVLKSSPSELAWLKETTMIETSSGERVFVPRLRPFKSPHRPFSTTGTTIQVVRNL